MSWLPVKSMKAACIVSLVVLFGGCQTTSPIAKSGALDDSAFMNLWTTYRHCEAGVGFDVDSMRVDALHLNAAAQYPAAGTGRGIPLPKAIARWISEPANRLAVDPKAMAVACSLLTGQTALSVGRYELAGEMFRVVAGYPEGSYPYYVIQAREGLDRLNADANLPEKIASAPSFTALLVSTAARK